MEEVLNSIKAKYSDHEDLDEIITDLSDNDSITYWAQQFCSEEFGHDIELVKSLLVAGMDLMEDHEYMNALELLASDKCVNDKELGRKAGKLAVEKVDNVLDYSTIAEMIAAEDILNDKEWATEIYKKAIEESEDSNEFLAIASSICKKNGLNDEAWAREMYNVSIEKAEDANDYEKLAYDIGDEDLLNDQEWAKEMNAKYEELK